MYVQVEVPTVEAVEHTTSRKNLAWNIQTLTCDDLRLSYDQAFRDGPIEFNERQRAAILIQRWWKCAGVGLV